MTTLVGEEIEYCGVMHIVTSKDEGMQSTVVTRPLTDESCMYGHLSNVSVTVLSNIQYESGLISCVNKGVNSSRSWRYILCRFGTV